MPTKARLAACAWIRPDAVDRTRANGLTRRPGGGVGEKPLVPNCGPLGPSGRGSAEARQAGACASPGQRAARGAVQEQAAGCAVPQGGDARQGASRLRPISRARLPLGRRRGASRGVPGQGEIRLRHRPRVCVPRGRARAAPPAGHPWAALGGRFRRRIGACAPRAAARRVSGREARPRVWPSCAVLGFCARWTRRHHQEHHATEKRIHFHRVLYSQIATIAIL